MLELFATDWRQFWQDAPAQEHVGVVFTRPEIVELILDLAGYDSASRLATRPLLEPSCGDGAFLKVIVDRLLQAEREYNGIHWANTALDGAIRAVDINAASVAAAQELVTTQLQAAGCAMRRAIQLAKRWIVHGDFLLSDWPHKFEFVIGNPPYVRVEDLPRRVLLRYRELFRTATDRADLYVAFFEKGLQLLSASGALAFISANRFTKNKYGEALRRLITKEYHVRHYINLEHTQPFQRDVSAYPAIIIVDRAKGQPTRAASLTDIKPSTLRGVRAQALGRRRPTKAMVQFESWYPDGEPWVTTSDEEHGLLSKLRDRLPTLEDSAPGTRVGIGVATGADSVFVLKERHPEIEESRQIPLLMPADVTNNALRWTGRYVLNPFSDDDDGSLVRLREYPGFAGYIENHAALLSSRHCAKSRPASWYRTIDRIWPSLRYRQKLMIPDIQGRTTIGLDDGDYYPHHNLYWVISEAWPLGALKALLRSSVVFQQVRAYSVQMRGGSVRFQAQTLRRLRLPALATVPEALLERLSGLAHGDSQEEIDDAANEAYSISS
jgi:methylase of polypeptide subunit release factors